ncbi:MAG TPA: hypothetical protein VLC91_17495 [Spongiibacteraceae bacterium]|nr:hypothetical protein [Spongiibacteraceae bacterium]
MEFTVEQAALLMAGIDPFEASLEEVKARRLSRWKQAHGHALGIVTAIRQGLITPVVCQGYVWRSGWNDELQRFVETMKPADRTTEISIADTVITRASLVGWITTEKVQIARRTPPRTIVAVQHSTLQDEEKEVAPLALPFHGHNSEGLEFVNEAIKQFWATFDPDDPATAPRKQEVIDYLKVKGATGNVAQAVDLILRPENMRKAGLKNNKAPTR